MKRSWFALALLLALPFAASANDSALSYNYVDAGYVHSDTRGDADGWGVGGSWAVSPDIHVFGSYADQNVDGEWNGYSRDSFDLTRWTLGVGYRHGLSENVDFVGRLAWNEVDFDGGDNNNGASVEGGVRAVIGQHLEGWAMAGYGDVDHGNGEFYGRVGMQAKFTDRFGIAGDVKFISGDTQWFVGPRIRW